MTALPPNLTRPLYNYKNDAHTQKRPSLDANPPAKPEQHQLRSTSTGSSSVQKIDSAIQ